MERLRASEVSGGRSVDQQPDRQGATGVDSGRAAEICGGVHSAYAELDRFSQNESLDNGPTSPPPGDLLHPWVLRPGGHMEYNDKLYFGGYPTDERTGFTLMIPDRGFLRHQREELGMTQQ